MKQFQDFSEVDSYFSRLFSSEESIFSQLKYGDIPIGVALQHNIYDYYKTFIHTPRIKTPIVERLLSLVRIYGLDHRFKLVINTFLGTKMEPLTKDKIVFFADNYVPRILEDFLKVIIEMDPSSVAFVTTDYRAYKYMREKTGIDRHQIVLLGSGLSKKARHLNGKEILDDRLLASLQKEFDGSARKIFRIIRFNLRVLVRYFSLFEEYVERAQPAKIVLGSDGFSVARLLCFAVKSKKINTYVLQHGMIDSLNGYLPLVADYIFLWSNLEKVFFQKNGVATWRLLLAGSPRFQQQSNSYLNDEKDIENNQLLFIIAPATPQDVYNQIDLIIEIARNLIIPYTVLIRPHPYYKRLAKDYFGTLKVDKRIILDEQPFEHSIAISKCVIFADVSTGIFEALRMNKSIYIMADQLSSKLDIYNFPRIELATLIRELNTGFFSMKENIPGAVLGSGVLSTNARPATVIVSYLN